MIFFAQNVHFNHLSFDCPGSKSLSYGGTEASNLRTFFKTHYLFIARCTPIAQMAGPMLSRVTVSCALLKLLVFV